MSVEDNKATVRRLWEEVFNQRKQEAMGEIATEQEARKIAWFCTLLTEAMPDLTVEVRSMLAEGDMVADAIVFRGTQTGLLGLPGFSLPATGRAAEIGMVNVWHLEDGKISEHSGHWDVLGAMRQLGISLPGSEGDGDHAAPATSGPPAG